MRGYEKDCLIHFLMKNISNKDIIPYVGKPEVNMLTTFSKNRVKDNAFRRHLDDYDIVYAAELARFPRGAPSAKVGNKLG